MLAFTVGPTLPAETLAPSRTLPIKPDAVELTGQRVRLIATDPARDAAPLYAASNGRAIQVGARSIGDYDAEQIIWRYLAYGPFADVAAFQAYLTQLVATPDLRAMTVLAQPEGQPVGIMTLMSNHPSHLKIELGHIWISPVMQGSGLIMEAAYLMLRHCFDLGYRRVEWKCDSLNERSRRMALKLGFTFEGIQEYHMIVKGRSRDTAWFRILDHEWLPVQAHLEMQIQK